MEKKKHWIRRPVAWMCTYLMMLVMEWVARIICNLGESVVGWLNGLSTAMIVILVVVFGGVAGSLLMYSVFVIPAAIVAISDKIYPSNHAVRYYLLGSYEIFGSALFIILAIAGIVQGGDMIWYYAKYIYLIILSVVMMITGRAKSEERHETAK